MDISSYFIFSLNVWFNFQHRRLSTKMRKSDDNRENVANWGGSVQGMWRRWWQPQRTNFNWSVQWRGLWVGRTDGRFLRVNKRFLSKTQIVRGARTVEVPWKKIKSVLTGGVRGPELSRSVDGVKKIPRTNFSLLRRGLRKFLKGQFLTSQPQKLPISKSRSAMAGENVATYLVPLTGNSSNISLLIFCSLRQNNWSLLGNEKAPSYLSTPCSALLAGSKNSRSIPKLILLWK